MTSPPPAMAPVDLTHAELVVLADVLTRVREGSETGTYQPLRDAALLTLRPQFATAAAKISEALGQPHRQAAAAAAPARTEGQA